MIQLTRTPCTLQVTWWKDVALGTKRHRILGPLDEEVEEAEEMDVSQEDLKPQIADEDFEEIIYEEEEEEDSNGEGEEEEEDSSDEN